MSSQAQSSAALSLVDSVDPTFPNLREREHSTKPIEHNHHPSTPITRQQLERERERERDRGRERANITNSISHLALEK